MGPIKFFSTFCLGLVLVSPAYANSLNPSLTEFVEGGLKVYQKFETPSVAESHKFMAYMVKQFADNQCVNSCTFEGEQAAKMYAANNKVKLDGL